MALSWTKIFTIVIFMDILLVAGLGIVGNQEDQSATIDARSNQLYNWTDETITNFARDNPDTSSSFLERAWGNIKYGLQTLWNLATIRPSIGQYSATSTTEDQIGEELIGLITLFMVIINIFMVIKLLLMIINKDTS